MPKVPQPGSLALTMVNLAGEAAGWSPAWAAQPYDQSLLRVPGPGVPPAPSHLPRMPLPVPEKDWGWFWFHFLVPGLQGGPRVWG